MNGKLASAEDLLSAESINPFVHHLELEGTYEKIKTALLTVILLPIRVMLICWLLIAGWMLACLGLWGVTDEDLRTRPLSGWRRETRELTKRSLVWMFYCAGFWRPRVLGQRALRSEAPIVILAPHSSFMDTLPVLLAGGPSIVGKRDAKDVPILGKLINYTQPVYVWREDPNSRQNTIREIVDRATSSLDWPQILIFPEGTCTNRSCLITFKPGAFYPGVPIQPVCIRYPNKLDTVTWTWEGPGAWKLLWLTLTQVTSQCEIEFLPVYRPSEQERRDPRLFASNVRNVMARALGVPVSDYTYDDCRLMTRAKRLHLPRAHLLPEVHKLRQRLGLEQQEREALDAGLLRKHDGMVSRQELARFFGLKGEAADSVAFSQLFRLYELPDAEMNLREYLLGVLAYEEEADSPLDVLKIACQVYDRSCTGRLSVLDWTEAIRQALPAVCEEEAAEIFCMLERDHQYGFITFDMFVKFASNKAEFADLFQLSKEEQYEHR